MPNPSPSPLPLFRADEKPFARRPWSLTLLCLGVGLVLGASWWHALSGAPARAFGSGYWAYLVATSATLASALWGLWNLRRWALWGFPLALLLDDVVVGAMGELRPGALCVQGALLLVVLGHFRTFPRTTAARPPDAR